MLKKNSTYFIYHRIKDMPLIGGYTDEELVRWIVELLDEIFSMQLTEWENEIIETLFLEYFSIIPNLGNTSEKLAFFRTYLQYILGLLISGYTEEE